MIQERILELTEYGLVTGLVEPEDRRFTINRLLELFHLDELDDEVAAAYAKRTPMTQESAEAALEDARLCGRRWTDAGRYDHIQRLI